MAPPRKFIRPGSGWFPESGRRSSQRAAGGGIPSHSAHLPGPPLHIFGDRSAGLQRKATPPAHLGLLPALAVSGDARQGSGRPKGRRERIGPQVRSASSQAPRSSVERCERWARGPSIGPAGWGHPPGIGPEHQAGRHAMPPGYRLGARWRAEGSSPMRARYGSAPVTPIAVPCSPPRPSVSRLQGGQQPLPLTAASRAAPHKRPPQCRPRLSAVCSSAKSRLDPSPAN